MGAEYKTYAFYHDVLLNHIKTTILPALDNKNDENLLKTYIKQYKDYILLSDLMRKVVRYLVRKR